MYYIFLIIYCVLGATTRYALELVLGGHHFPLATLIINIVGCFLLAFVMRYLSRIRKLSAEMVSAMGTGFIGSFTTFSTFALESAELIQIGDYLNTVIYISVSLFGGLGACILGYRTSMICLIHRKRRMRHGI